MQYQKIFKQNLYIIIGKMLFIKISNTVEIFSFFLFYYL